MGKSWENGKSGKSGKKWEKVGKVGKSGRKVSCINFRDISLLLAEK